MHQLTLRIPAPLRSFTGGASELFVEADTVRGALQAAGSKHDALLSRILDQNGELRAFVNLFVGSTNVSQLDGLDTPVRSNDVVAILPAVAGGRR